MFQKLSILINRRDKLVPCVYSQEYRLNANPVFLNEPSSKSETAGISEVDHGLGEGIGETIYMSLFHGVPAQKETERKN